MVSPLRYPPKGGELLDLVEFFFRDYVVGDSGSVVVSRAEALDMSLKDLRGQVRRAREVYAAANAVGDSAAKQLALDSLNERARELQVAVLRENGLGVSTKDVPTGKSEVVPARSGKSS